MGVELSYVPCVFLSERRSRYMLMNDNLIVQVYAILDEVFLAGEIEETSKTVVLSRLEHLDKLE